MYAIPGRSRRSSADRHHIPAGPPPRRVAFGLEEQQTATVHIALSFGHRAAHPSPI
jgi:hypothetical protein